MLDRRAKNVEIFKDTEYMYRINEELRELLKSRIKRIFEIAMANGAEVLILGAFGCGAFRNPSKLVAEVFAEYTREYRNCFDAVEYAIFHVENEKVNFEAFIEEMNQFL